MNSRTIDSIYSSIAENMNNNLPDGWLNASIDVEREAGDVLEIGGGYETEEEKYTSFKFRDFDRRIISDFHDLHGITTACGSNRWNKAKFILYPMGKFEINFEWDQSLEEQ